MMDDVERQLREIERREPQREMRERVLAATMPLVRPNDSRLDGIWFSRKWRMAAVLVFFVLAGVEAVSSHLIAPAPVGQDRPAADPAQTVAIAAVEVGLTPADAALLVAQAIAATRPPALPQDVNPRF